MWGGKSHRKVAILCVQKRATLKSDFQQRETWLLEYSTENKNSVCVISVWPNGEGFLITHRKSNTQKPFLCGTKNCVTHWWGLRHQNTHRPRRVSVKKGQSHSFVKTGAPLVLLLLFFGKLFSQRKKAQKNAGFFWVKIITNPNETPKIQQGRKRERR